MATVGLYENIVSIFQSYLTKRRIRVCVVTREVCERTDGIIFRQN